MWIVGPKTGVFNIMKNINLRYVNFLPKKVKIYQGVCVLKRLCNVIINDYLFYAPWPTLPVFTVPT